MSFITPDFFFLLWVLFSIGGLLSLVLSVIALVDVVRSNFENSTDKLIWVLVILFAPFIGAILYFVVGRSKKIK